MGYSIGMKTVHPASIARPFGVTGVVSDEAAGNEGSADLNDDGDGAHLGGFQRVDLRLAASGNAAVFPLLDRSYRNAEFTGDSGSAAEPVDTTAGIRIAAFRLGLPTALPKRNRLRQLADIEDTPPDLRNCCKQFGIRLKPFVAFVKMQEQCVETALQDIVTVDGCQQFQRERTPCAERPNATVWGHAASNLDWTIHPYGLDKVDALHAATSVRRLFGLAVNLAGTRTPFSFASSRNGNMRHAGIALEMFQPDTVETGAPIASATATVPSRLSMNSLTVMFETLRKT